MPAPDTRRYAAMTASSLAGRPPAGPMSLLREREFRAVWVAGGLNGVVRWLELLAVGVYVYQVTGSAFLVMLVSMLRILPLALTGAFMGAFAERLGRHRLYIGGVVGMVALCAAQAGLVLAGSIQVWHLAVGSLLSGIFWAMDLPVRRTLLCDIAGNERVAQAMSLDAATNNATRIAGPMLGGLLLELLGLDGVFVCSVVVYLATLVLVRRVQERGAPAAAGTRVLASLLEGLRIAARSRTIVGTLAITVIFNVFAFPVTSMVPVVGKDVLGLSAFPVGLLMSADGAGALVGAVLIAIYGRAPIFRRLYWGGCTLYLLMVLAFAAAPNFPLAGTALLVLGLGSAAFGSMQATLIYLAAPAEARSRLMGVLSVAVGSGPIGFLHVGWLADSLGAPAALAIMAVEGLIAMLLVLIWWPEVR